MQFGYTQLWGRSINCTGLQRNVVKVRTVCIVFGNVRDHSLLP